MNLYPFVYHIAKLYARVFYRVRFFGSENEPESGSYIAFSNHTSYSDPIFTACGLKRPVSFMAKSTLKKNPILKWLFRVCGVFTVNRGESDIHAVRVAIDALRAGRNIALYPQGTRQQGVDPIPSLALPGIGLIAKKTGAVLLPVTICYGKKKPCIFRRVDVYIGKPILPEEYLASGEMQDSREISEYCFKRVCDTFAEKNNA